MNKRIIKKIILISIVLICISSTVIYADGELLKRGDSSADVALLQRLLKEKGYFDYDSITGYYGKITEDAVKAFQKEYNLKVDGVTGPATWAALLSDKADDDEYDLLESDEIIIDDDVKDDNKSYSIGMECADVALIQSRLNDLGFYNYDHITGYFGSVTQKAVMAFQRAFSVDTTGIVNEETWNKLFDDYVADALMQGMVSEAVIPLQTRLQELGYYSFALDGNYGPKTTEAVTYFQKASGLTANGIADSTTQEKLFSEDAINEQEARRLITSKGEDGIVIANAEPRAEDIVELAKQYLGYPYVYGADGPDAFDCAGFISYIYDLVGVSLPDSIYMNNYDNYGTKINSRLDLQIGDLVFFDTIYTDGMLADHVGIYIGDGKFIHVDNSFNKRSVVIDSILEDNGWYTARFSHGRRIIN